MADYRVYVVGPDGHIVDATVLRCADDQAALRSAERLLRKDTLELNIRFCDFPLPGVHWDNVHQNNVNDNGTYPKLGAGINHPSGGGAKASGTMIEVVTASLVFLSAVIFVAHAFVAFSMR